MTTYHIINQYQPTDSLIQYGDGVFETMLGVDNEIYHWDYHWSRLAQSCVRLAISTPEKSRLYNDIQTMLNKALNTALDTELNKNSRDFFVVKMIVSRGEGLRGYRSHDVQPCFVHISVAPYAFNSRLFNGLNVRVCKSRLSKQPLLAGMKHCNRLEYIMARREDDDEGFDEGLLLDYDNHLIEGLISNVFVVYGNRICTPDLRDAGVRGTMRAFLLDRLPDYGYIVEVATLTLSDLIDADAVFLTNATNGMMPVKSIQGIDKLYDIHAPMRIRQILEHPSL